MSGVNLCGFASASVSFGVFPFTGETSSTPGTFASSTFSRLPEAASARNMETARFMVPTASGAPAKNAEPRTFAPGIFECGMRPTPFTSHSSGAPGTFSMKQALQP
jgi:hypothetical protein